MAGRSEKNAALKSAVSKYFNTFKDPFFVFGGDGNLLLWRNNGVSHITTANGKGMFMNLEDIVSMLHGKSKVKSFKFIAEKGSDSCKSCLAHHGKIFRSDDPGKPKLPIHPNCRCRYIEVKEPDTKVESSEQNNSKGKNFLQNLPEAIQNALEMKFLATGTGEIIGGVKVASVLVTEYKLWAIRARNTVIGSNTLSPIEQNEILAKLEIALAKNDIRTILTIYNKYK